MADWWNTFTTRLGDMMIQPQSFGGMMPPPTDPDQRQAMIANGLMTLGGAVTKGAQTRQPIMASIGRGWRAMQQQGQERGQQQLQQGLLMSKLGEQQRHNQLYASDLGAAGILASTTIVPYVTAKMITNPTFVRWLAGAETFGKGASRDAMIGRLAAIAEANPEIRDETLRLQQVLSSSGAGEVRR